jgi:glycine cleavage system H protein
MKEINELILPENIRYTEDHEWARLEGEIVKIGLTDYAQDQLGDIVFVEFPEVGDSFSKGDEFGTIESVKAVSEIIMPVSGEVVAINEDLENVPELVNKEPYEGGWLIEVKPEDTQELDALMDKTAYMKVL